jgi:hypothetical protein
MSQPGLIFGVRATIQSLDFDLGAVWKDRNLAPAPVQSDIVVLAATKESTSFFA